MKIMKLKQIYVLPLLLFMVTNSHAELNLSIGKKLSKEELSTLNSKDIQLGDQAFKVIPEQKLSSKTIQAMAKKTPNFRTFVTDQRGVVGISENRVIVAELSPTQLRLHASHLISSAATVKYYDHLNTSALQFQNFNQAVSARNELVKLFPNAKITVPIRFSEIKAQ